MAPLPKMIVASAGMATSRPTVATTLISGEVNLRWRNKTA
jgi:hypothetical protein